MANTRKATGHRCFLAFASIENSDNTPHSIIFFYENTTIFTQCKICAIILSCYVETVVETVVIWVILYGIIYSFSEYCSNLFGVNHILTIFATMLYIVALLIFLKKQKRLSVYGLCLPKYWRESNIGWLIPLLTFPLANIYLQRDQTIFQNSWIIFILTLFTVFLEEFFFRGYLLAYLWRKFGTRSKWIGMIVSSLLFGMFHIVNLFQGADLLYTLIQMLCACGVGLCLCVLVLKYKSIFPGIIIHFLINITSSDIGKSGYPVLLCFFVLSALHVFYAFLLDKKLRTLDS